MNTQADLNVCYSHIVREIFVHEIIDIRPFVHIFHISHFEY